MNRTAKTTLEVRAPERRTLCCAPELIATDTLRVVIDQTLIALRVANPELLAPGRFDGRELLCPQLWIAHQILALAQPLQRALEHYRRAIENGPARYDTTLDDHDNPF